MNSAHHLRPLLAPTSVALVGASGRAGSLGRIVCENLLAGGFSGELHLVNPKRNTVLGSQGVSLLALDRPAHRSRACLRACRDGSCHPHRMPRARACRRDSDRCTRVGAGGVSPLAAASRQASAQCRRTCAGACELRDHATRDRAQCDLRRRRRVTGSFGAHLAIGRGGECVARLCTCCGDRFLVGRRARCSRRCRRWRTPRIRVGRRGNRCNRAVRRKRARRPRVPVRAEGCGAHQAGGRAQVGAGCGFAHGAGLRHARSRSGLSRGAAPGGNRPRANVYAALCRGDDACRGTHSAWKSSGGGDQRAWSGVDGDRSRDRNGRRDRCTLGADPRQAQGVVAAQVRARQSGRCRNRSNSVAIRHSGTCGARRFGRRWRAGAARRSPRRTADRHRACCCRRGARCGQAAAGRVARRRRSPRGSRRARGWWRGECFHAGRRGRSVFVHGGVPAQSGMAPRSAAAATGNAGAGSEGGVARACACARRRAHCAEHRRDASVTGRLRRDDAPSRRHHRRKCASGRAQHRLSGRVAARGRRRRGAGACASAHFSGGGARIYGALCHAAA